MIKQRWRVTLLLSLAFIISLVVLGCGTQPAPNTAPAKTVGKLTLGLDASLDGGGDVKATSITKAELLDTKGTVVATATINGGARTV